MTAHIIAAASEAGAKLVMVDDLHMYGPTQGPLVESLPRAATGRKGVLRPQMERHLLDAHESGALRVTIGRLSDYYGPHGPNSTIAALVREPAVRGKAMCRPGSTTVPRTLHFLADAARGLLVLADQVAADGTVWHLPAAPPITGEQYMELVNQFLPSAVKAGSIGTSMMRIGGLFSKSAKESVECMYQWTAPFVVDSSAFESAFGPLTVTPHVEAITTTIASMRRA
jgi:nucleoside-diphosphate-sugar epimerase